MFNLVDDPWLPVRYADGRQDEVGLRVALRDSQQIADLAIPFALEYVATLRMLVTVLQSACRGPRSTAEKTRWLDSHSELWPRANAYVDEYWERFGLFHPERPFMQQVMSDDVQPQTIAALRVDWSSGNNVTVFDHRLDRRPSPLPGGAAARALLTTLLFQPGGGVSKPFNRTDSPGTKGLQVLLEGRDLWETLVANAPNLKADAGRPVWEWDEPTDRPRREGTLPDGWLDRATWRSRAVQLIPNPDGRVALVRMHQHLKLIDAPPFDPHTPMRHEPGKEATVVRASPGKALWRDAEALIVGLCEHPTAVVQALEAFEERGDSEVRKVRVIGQVVNQAKIGDVREGRMPLTRALLESHMHLEAVGGLVYASEQAAKTLRSAIHKATEAMGAADGWARATHWETGFWAELAAPFGTRLERIAGLAEPDAVRAEVSEWREETASASGRVYGRFAADGALGRAPRAVGLGQAVLATGLRKLRTAKETV